MAAAPNKHFPCRLKMSQRFKLSLRSYRKLTIVQLMLIRNEEEPIHVSVVSGYSGLSTGSILSAIKSSSLSLNKNNSWLVQHTYIDRNKIEERNKMQTNKHGYTKWGIVSKCSGLDLIADSRLIVVHKQQRKPYEHNTVAISKIVPTQVESATLLSSIRASLELIQNVQHKQKNAKDV
jgi:hypothetical protein